MTEQEFRERLKCAARNDGLSAEHQAQVLARRKGDEHKVRNWHKAKYILVIALLLATGVTGAVAGGVSLIDWNGKPSQAQQVSSDRRMMELMNKHSYGQAVSVLKWNEEEDEYHGVLAADMELVASSLEKLQSWVETDGTLPWPANIPETYPKMSRGDVRYVCDAEGELHLRKQEVTEDGYIVSCFQLPNDHRFMTGYTINLYNDDRQQLSIWLDLAEKQWKSAFPIEDGSTFTELNVDGMMEAIAIETASETRLALRQAVQPPLTYKVVAGHPDGVVKETLMEYDCIEIQIIGQGSPADLLAIFGLEAQ